eukprot:TRINITY_DN54963_c0_g1_i1.p1 TRINITY_DN54963_c0_g1~~TRINITY_DN54963_c0_g1_i1.p1  ORF type:complete len:643 (+),score=85.63 TRINITY_DN54963_c0_g1_i1:73-1929(+)
MTPPCETLSPADGIAEDPSGKLACTNTFPRCVEKIVKTVRCSSRPTSAMREPKAVGPASSECVRFCGSACGDEEQLPPLPSKMPRNTSRSTLNPLLDPLLNAMERHFAESREHDSRGMRTLLAQLQAVECKLQSLEKSVEASIAAKSPVLVPPATVDKPRFVGEGIIERQRPESVTRDKAMGVDRSGWSGGTGESTQNCEQAALDQNRSLTERDPSNADAENSVAPEEATQMMLMVDVVPACVVATNAIIIGLSIDIYPESYVWTWFEFVFVAFFLGEIFFKLRLFGMRVFFWGSEYLWNMFDCFCASAAVLEACITIQGILTGEKFADISGLTMMKMLRLIKLMRLVRLLRFRIFVELRNIVTGLASGMRVLVWAQVLLGLVIYLGGIVMTNLIGDAQLEFSTLPASMFSLFRCFTDGCSAYDGSPLHERIRREYGAVVFIGWTFSYLFVTIGIFNLIMAVFIDHVSEAQSVQRKLKLGKDSARVQQQVSKATLWLRQPSGDKASEPSDQCSQMCVNRDDFNTWIVHPEMTKILEDADVDLASKFEIFDVLDVDSNGILTVEELTVGIMNLRGPIRKTEIVAMRLKIEFALSQLQHTMNATQQILAILAALPRERLT